MRARAAHLGYVLAVAAMGVICILNSFAPLTLSLAIPLLMATAFIVPTMYLLWADWWASRDG